MGDGEGCGDGAGVGDIVFGLFVGLSVIKEGDNVGLLVATYSKPIDEGLGVGEILGDTVAEPD